MTKRIGVWCLLITWSIVVVVLVVAYWNEKEVNDKRERHLLKELRLNNELMAEQSAYRKIWEHRLDDIDSRLEKIKDNSEKKQR
jgi:hypothetical protein